jgi:hypothetical protein
MVILLTGASGFVRGAVAESAISDRPDWRHLNVEDLVASAGGDEEGVLVVLEKCVSEMKKEGFSLILSLPADEGFVSALRRRLIDHVTVFIGKEEELPPSLNPDEVMDSAKVSLQESMAFMSYIIKQYS